METTSLFRTIAAAQATQPVDVERLANQLGVRVKYVFMPDGMSGALVRVSDDHYEIKVNNMHPETRQRFTIAHELGHYVHHRSLLGDGVNDSRAYRTTTDAAYYNPRIGPRQETQANQFAASLLMPEQVVASMRRAGRTVKEMARALKVSQHAMSIRVGQPYHG